MRTNNPLIFVVEDSRIYNNLIVSHLKSNGYNNVQAFFSGEECVANLSSKPDIVIQDYLLEGITGFDVLKRAKELSSGSKFIFMSGQNSVEVAINVIKSGAADYIVKDQDALKKMVQSINDLMQTEAPKSCSIKKKCYVTLALGLTCVVLAALLVLSWLK